MLPCVVEAGGRAGRDEGRGVVLVDEQRARARASRRGRARPMTGVASAPCVAAELGAAAPRGSAPAARSRAARRRAARRADSRAVSRRFTIWIGIAQRRRGRRSARARAAKAAASASTPRRRLASRPGAGSSARTTGPAYLQVDAPGPSRPARRRPRARSRASASRLERLRTRRRPPSSVSAVERAQERPDQVVLELGLEQADRAEHARRRRHDAPSPIPSERAISAAKSGPLPPNATSAKSRGSRPRSTVTARTARAIRAQPSR